MAKKNTADVLINGKVYTISGYESTAYLQKVATYLNEMEEKVAVTEGYARLTADEKQLLKNMNLADVYFKADAARESLEKEKEQKDRELYSLKHDLIDAKMEKEKLMERIHELEAQLEKAQKQTSRQGVENRQNCTSDGKKCVPSGAETVMTEIKHDKRGTSHQCWSLLS